MATPTSKKFNKAYARVLLRIAEEDLTTANILVKHPEGRPENTCFIIQQAVEKAIKAVLCHYELNIPLTHDIGALLSVLPDKVPKPPDAAALLGLSEFATIRRYEEGHFVITHDEIKDNYELAVNVIQWAKTLIL